MKNTDRRNFIKVAAAGGMAALAAPLFPSPMRSMSGMREVGRARGNVTSSIPMVDSCCQMPDDENGMEAFLKATATYGVQGSLFVPSPKTLGHWTPEGAASVNAKSAAFAQKFGNAKFAAAISLDDPAAAMAEIERCSASGKFAALAFPFNQHGSGFISSEESSLVFFEKAAVLGMPVIVVTLCGPANFSDETVSSHIGWFADMILRSGKIGGDSKIILPAYGGFFTWLKAVKSETMKPEDNPFYFFAGGKISADAFKCFKNVFGGGRLLLGSCGNMNYSEVLKNVEDLSLSADDFKKTCFQNANRLFGFEVKEWE